ncbi:MASE1 domain-containing protein [Streptomyces sp. HNM0574]|uniref:MASE1 domain-containing protein n=1 Tax=Streptomyces sp. HNM0574 TaxID=2714954 RepID=UPI00146A1509|nr:MASE1 domain-containing protein [Streptomyces sp. HNM0574]NLU69909.1 hypothetical protein [Streptomyces sp. HNM0574]
MALLRVLAVAAGYYAAGRIGLLRQVAVEGAVVTPLWPATGVALACLLWMGTRIWPGIALGALGVIATIASVDLNSVFLLMGNTLAPVCSYLMLQYAGFRTALDRVRDGVALVFLGALGGMLISATVATCLLVLDAKLPLESFGPVWTAWWVGDAMGVLVFTPLLLVLRRIRLPRTARRWAEAVALVVVAVPLTLVATRSSLGLLFLVFPLLIWAALRFQLAGSAPCALLVSGAGVWAATDHAGPFSGLSLMQGMVTLQALNGSAALTALLLAAVVTEQANMRARIEDACQELAEVVERLAPEENPDRWRVRGRGGSEG